MTSLADEARIVFDNLTDRGAGLFHPNLRLGVAGLSRAGKTVFITSLVHNLVHGGRLPLFEAQASGRIRRAFWRSSQTTPFRASSTRSICARS